jgi:hypothetical protein
MRTIADIVPVHLQAKTIITITAGSLCVSTRLTVHRWHGYTTVKLNIDAARGTNPSTHKANTALKRPRLWILKLGIGTRAAST